MSDTIGRVTVPIPPASGATFPFQPISPPGPAKADYPYGMTRDWQLIEHRFQAETTLAVQRFLIGPGARRFHFRKSAMSFVEWATLIAFYNANQGGYQTFTYNVPNADRVGYTAYTVMFDSPPLSIEHFQTMCRVGFDLIEVVSTGPSYTVSSTVTRFPSTGLATALLSQTQQLIPLIHIRVRDPAVPDMWLSDRRCTVGGQLYLPRVLELGEPGQNVVLSQDIGGKADAVTFVLGNADRVMSAVCADTSLKYASIDLTLYHVQSQIAIQIWEGVVINYKIDGSPKFALSCSDGVYALTQNYPKRTVSRYCWKTFNTGACPWAANHTSIGAGQLASYGVSGASWASGTATLTIGAHGYTVGMAVNISGVTPIGWNVQSATISAVGGSTVSFLLGNNPGAYSGGGTVVLACDYGFNTTGGCLAHGMSPYFGGHPEFPQNVVIKDDGTGILGGLFGRNTVNSTSIVSDSIWGKPLPDIWCNDLGNPQLAYWAGTLMASVRDESTFEDTLAIVGAGPLGQYEGMSVQKNADGYMFLVCPLADGFPPQGFKVNGQYQVTSYMPNYGLREVVGNDPASPTTDPFSLGQGGQSHGGGSTLLNILIGIFTGIPAPLDPSTSGPNNQIWDLPDPVFGNVLTGAANDILPMAAGTAFVELRYSKSAGSGIAPTTAEQHTMQVPISTGLTGVTFDYLGNPATVPGLTNNAWVAANTYLRALGLDQASTSAQLNALVLPSFANAGGSGSADVCDDYVAPIVGVGLNTATLTAAGIAVHGNFNVLTQTFTYQQIVSIAAALSTGYIQVAGSNIYTLTATGQFVNGQVIPPQGSFAGAFIYIATMSLSAAVSAGYGVYSTTSGQERQWQFQGSIAEFKPLRDQLISILNSCLGYFTFEFGRLKVGLRYNASAVASFSAANMLYQSLSIEAVPSRFEYLQVNFANSALQYQLDMAEYQDKDYASYMGRAGAPLTSRINVPGLSTLSQALRYAATRTREEIGGVLRTDQPNPYIEFDNNNMATWRTTVLALDTEVGAVVEVTHPDLPTYPGPVGGSALAANTWKFRIVKWTLHKDWSITIQARSVVDSMYDLTVGPKPADVAVVKPPVLFYPEPLGVWLADQVQAVSTDPVYAVGSFGGQWTFDVTQTYANLADGTLGPAAAVTAKLPVNQFIPGCPPPSVKQGTVVVTTTGGTIPGGSTWRVQVCARNAAGQFSPPSEIVLVQVPSGTNTNAIALNGVQWPQIDGLTGWQVFGSIVDDAICAQPASGTLTNTGTAPYTYTPVNVAIANMSPLLTVNVPNANVAKVRVKAKRLIHGGPIGLLVTGVGVNSIACTGAIDGTSTDNWGGAGRKLMVIGRAPGAGSAPWATYSISSFAASTGVFTLATDPTGKVQTGDAVVVSFLGYDNSATPAVFTDAGLSNISDGHTGETVNDPNRVGNYIRVLNGKGMGLKGKILSNTATSYTLDTPIAIDTTSVWIVETAAWDGGSTTDLDLTNADPTASTILSVPLENYGELPVLIGLFAVDGQGNESGEQDALFRMLWVSGALGTATVTASVTQKPTDGLVKFVTTAPDHTLTATAVATAMLIGDTAATLTVAYPGPNGSYFTIDTETVLVTAGAGTADITIVRAQKSTAAAAHATSAVVTLPGFIVYTMLPYLSVPNQLWTGYKATTDINYVQVVDPAGTNYYVTDVYTNTSLGVLQLKAPGV